MRVGYVEREIEKGVNGRAIRVRYLVSDGVPELSGGHSVPDEIGFPSMSWVTMKRGASGARRQ